MWAYRWKPILGVTGILSKPDGEILWQKYAVLSNLDKRITGHKRPWVEYLNDPELVKVMVEEGSKFIAKNLVRELKK